LGAARRSKTAAAEILAKDTVDVILPLVPAGDPQRVSCGRETRMASDQVKRKLAAILATEIAGYSRLSKREFQRIILRRRKHGAHHPT
jgi:hypothetical protein